jgi:hypothetical protein
MKTKQVNPMKTELVNLAMAFFFAVAAAQAAPADARFLGGNYDGWDGCTMTNSTGLGGAIVTLSSGSNQVFDFMTVSAPLAVLVLTAENPAGTITNGGTIRICVPAAWACRFDTAASVSFSGAAAGKVGEASYADGGRTLNIPVTSDFAAGDALAISGLRLLALSLVPLETRQLELDSNGDGARDKYDDYTLAVRAMWPGGSYDGWDRGAMAESAGLTPRGGTIITIR